MAEHNHHDVEVKKELALANPKVYALARELLEELNTVRRNVDITVESIKEMEALADFEEVLNSYEHADKDDILNNIYALKRLLDTTRDFC